MTVPAGSAWVSLGPAPITGLGRFGDASGRITSIAVDQNDSTGNTVYVAGAYGGVWKSTNAANADPTLVTWTPIYDADPAAVTLAAGAVSIQPTNSSVILVGTGEPNNALDSYYGMGILRSTNGGASWTLITSATGGQPFSGMGVSKFAWKPDGSLVVAGFGNGTNEGSVGAGGGFQGIYYSTDGGATWSRATNSPDTIFGSVSDVVYNASLSKFFASLKGQGIYTSSDGATWTRLAFQPVSFAASCNTGATCDMLRAALTVRPGAADMYAWVVASNGTTNRGIGKTTNGGTTGWSPLTITGINSCGDTRGGCGTSQGFYDLVLAAVPNGANTDLFAGAVNLFKCANSNSTTCTTWLNLTHVYGSCSASNVSIHPDQHAIDFLQSNTNIVYFGNDGGVYRTLTAQTGMSVGTCTTATHNDFQDLNTSSLGSLTQFISISHHPTDDSVILGGTQDNGSPAIASGQASPPLNPPLWFEANGGDGGYNEIDQTNSNNWYTANTDVSIQKCTTGTNCIEIDFFNSIVTSTTLSGDHGDFYTPYILDRANQAKLLVGTCRVWRGNNDGTGFTKLSNKLVSGATTVCSASESSYVYSLAAGGPSTANGSQVIYAGTNDGKIFVTTNADGGTGTWVDRTGSINSNAFVVSKVAIDTTDSTGQTAYVTIMGFTGGGGHVFKTTNAGGAWTDISASLPNAPADSVVVDPIDHTILYVGTDVGVFATNDNGATWNAYGTGLPNVATVALRTFNSGGSSKLRVGTHGRGVWETNLASALSPDFSINISDSPQSAFPSQSATFHGTVSFNNGFAGTVNLSCTSSGALPATCNISPNSFTPTGGSFTVTVSHPSVNDFSLNVHGTNGATLNHDEPFTFHVVDFTFGGVSPNPLTVPPATSQTVNFTTTPQGSFSGQISVTCQTPLPAGLSCSTFNGPAGAGSISVTAAQNTVLATYNITLQASSTIGSTTRTQTQGLTLTVTDFSLSISPPSATVFAGGSAAYTVTVGALGGSFNNAVALTCSLSSAVGTCSFSSASVTPGNNSATSTLTVLTNATVAGSPPLTSFGLPAVAFLLWMPLASVLATAAAGRRSSKKIALALLAFLLAGILMASCGGGGAAAPPPPRPPQTVTVTVTATSTGAQHSATTTLTVTH